MGEREEWKVNSQPDKASWDRSGQLEKVESSDGEGAGLKEKEEQRVEEVKEQWDKAGIEERGEMKGDKRKKPTREEAEAGQADSKTEDLPT